MKGTNKMNPRPTESENLLKLFQLKKEYNQLPIHSTKEFSLQFYSNFQGVLNDENDTPILGWNNLEEGIALLEYFIESDSKHLDNDLFLSQTVSNLLERSLVKYKDIWEALSDN